MPSSKLLKERIESIQDTMKITNAMYLISSSKLRKARKNYQNVSPYFNRMRDTISRVVPHLPDEPEPHAGDGIPHPGEVGQNILVVLPGLAELGGGNQVHGIRDLHGILNALDPLLEQLTGCHCSPLPRMPSTRSGWCPPVPG